MTLLATMLASVAAAQQQPNSQSGQGYRVRPATVGSNSADRVVVGDTSGPASAELWLFDCNAVVVVDSRAVGVVKPGVRFRFNPALASQPALIPGVADDGASVIEVGQTDTPQPNNTVDAVCHDGNGNGKCSFRWRCCTTDFTNCQPSWRDETIGDGERIRLSCDNDARPAIEVEYDENG